MTHWTPTTLIRSITFYITATIATFYVLIRPLPRTFISWVYRRQAERRHWYGLSSLPPYIHKYNKNYKQQHNISNNTNSNEDGHKNNSRNNHNNSYPYSTTGKQYLSGNKLIEEHKFWSLSRCPIVQREYVTPDDIHINYYIIYPGNPRTMCIANGLGVSRNFVGFAPLIYRYGAMNGDWSFITWDYRGLFDNGPVQHKRKLAVHHHSDDLHHILKQENINKIDCLVGFSMGVQITLEFAVMYPDTVDKLILCNGSYGNVLKTLYQPFVRVPYFDTLLYYLTQLVVDNTWLFRVMYKPARVWILCVGYIYSFFLGSPFLRELLGTDYLVNFFDEYVGGVVSSPRHSENYMRLVLEMNAHSVYHQLRYIQQSTLILSGLLDPLTPCYLSYEMSRLIPNNKHINIKYSSHFTLLEQPRQALRAIIEHLEGIQFNKLSHKSFIIDSDRSNIDQQSLNDIDIDEYKRARKVIVPK